MPPRVSWRTWATGRATSTRTTRPTRAWIRTTSPRRSAGASTTGRPTAGSRPSSAGGSPSGGAGAPSGGGRRHSRVVLRPEELVALAPARLRRRLPPELFRLRVVGTTGGRDRVARGEARRRQGVPREDRPRRRDLHGLRVQLPDAATSASGVRKLNTKTMKIASAPCRLTWHTIRSPLGWYASCEHPLSA